MSSDVPTGSDGAPEGAIEPAMPVENEYEDAPLPPEAGEDVDFVRIEVVMLPDRFTIELQAATDSSVMDLIESLAESYKIFPENITLSLPNGETPINRDGLLSEYFTHENDDAPLRFDARVTLIEAAQQTEEEKMPDVIQVKIHQINQPVPSIVNVRIVRENLQTQKPYLGGFRRRVSGRLLFHAATQTKNRIRKPQVQRYERATQTIKMVSRGRQTMCESGTQVARKDLFIDDRTDRYITPRPYFSAEKLENVRHERAVEIQCFIRQCFAWRRLAELRAARRQRIKTAQDEEQAKLAKERKIKEKQRQIRLNPRTRNDFQLLYTQLKEWREVEVRRVKLSDLSEEEKHDRLADILKREVALLQEIDRMKIVAKKGNKIASIHEMLERMASPQEWEGKTGDLVEVETPFTTRARELVELYKGLTLFPIQDEQRVDILDHLKYTVMEFDCPLSREIVELRARELDLMRRGRPAKSLVGLRTRLSNLFLQFIKTPEFNPEAANYVTAPPLAGEIA